MDVIKFKRTQIHFFYRRFHCRRRRRRRRRRLRSLCSISIITLMIIENRAL